MSKLLTVPAMVAAAGLCTSAFGQTTFNETEANDTKAAANGPFVMTAGDMIVGNSTGTSTTTPGAASADNFLVQTAGLTAGIYRHRLVITTTGTAGHTGTIRGLTQTAGAINAGTDAAVQTSSTTTTPARFVQWYGFGGGEQVYFRVTGASTTTADYTATLETQAAPIVDAGTYISGSFTISRGAGNTTNTDFWLYDSNFNAIPNAGNDEPNTLTTSLAPGTYYVAWTNTNLANNQPAAPGDTNLTASVMDFANAVANSNTTIATGLGIRISDTYGPTDTAASKSGAYDVVWVRFTVDGVVPTNGACCLADGTCSAMRSSSCALAGGVYQGDGVACASVTCPQPGACCFAATQTCQVLSSGQCTTAGGVFLGGSTVCGSCPPPPPGSVAIYAAETAGNISDVYAKVNGTGLFPLVVMKNVISPAPTPTLAELQQYRAVLVWTNSSLSDGAAMGNVLADYVDAGGGVVLGVFVNTTTTANRFLAGRWDASYQIIPHMLGTTSGTQQSLGTIVVPGHPILNSVNTFIGGTSSFRPTTTTLTPHGQLIAQWTDGKTLVATSSTQQRRVDLGMFPVSNGTGGTANWTQTTDGARLMANALLYAGRNLSTCYPNCDNSTTPPVLNVQDFGCFLNAFAAGDTYANCDGSTTAPVLNVQDFGCFLNSFAAGCT